MLRRVVALPVDGPRRRPFKPPTQVVDCSRRGIDSAIWSDASNFFHREQNKSVPTNRPLRIRYLSSLHTNYQLSCPDDLWNKLRLMKSQFGESCTSTRPNFYRHKLRYRKIYRRCIGSTSSLQVPIIAQSHKEWNVLVAGLLDESIYPVGFSVTPQSESIVTSWCQQVNRALLHMKPLSQSNTFLMEPALQLLDRLFREQEEYNIAAAKSHQICGGGILMSSEVSSAALANALECWRDSLLEPNSRHNETTIARDRLELYGKYLASHEGSVLSRIATIIGPNRKTQESTNSTPDLPIFVDVETSTFRKKILSEISINEAPSGEYVSEAPVVTTSRESSRQFEDDELVGFPLFEATTNPGAVDDDNINEHDKPGKDFLFLAALKQQRQYRDTRAASNSELLKENERAVLAGNKWDCTYNRLMNRIDFPVGFSRKLDKNTVNLWYSEVEQLLRQAVPETTEQACELLVRWQEEEQNAEPNHKRAIADFALHQLLEAWQSILGNTEFSSKLLKPEEMWEKIINLRVSYQSKRSEAETVLSIIIRSIGIIETREVAPVRANLIFESFLQLLVTEAFRQDLVVYLNNVSILHLLRLWYRSNLPEAPLEADRLLELLKDWCNTYSDEGPDDNIYATIISIWTARAPPGKAIHRAEILINEMQREPSFVVLGTFIDTLAKAGHVERAHGLLNKYIRLQSDSLERRPKSDKNIQAFEGCNPIFSIFQAYRARLDRQPLVAIVQMERFISQLEKIACDYPSLRSVFHPNISCYNVLIGGYSHLRTPQKAEGLLGHVMRLLKESQDKIIAAEHASNEPVVSLFNNVLNAFARSNEAECVPCALTLVRSMETKCRIDPFYQPNHETYSILLSCIVGDRRNTSADNARSAQELLERMLKDLSGFLPKPNADCYDIVLRAWCRAGYPDLAETILLNLCNDAETLLASKKDKSVVTNFPSYVEFLIVMQGWAAVARRRNGHHQALSRVEYLLQRMHILHLKGFPTKPSVTAHNIFLECLTKSEESYAPERAESFLHMMEKHGKDDPSLVPDVVIFNSVLNTWLRSNRYDSPMKATALYQKMKNLKNCNVRVMNANSYITMMGIYMQHALPSKVQDIFDELMQTDESKIRVPLTAYTTLMHSWSLAGKPDKALKVVQLLKKEYESGRIIGPAKDALIAFNSVLKCFVDSKKFNTADDAEECLVLMNLISSSGNFEFDIRPNHTSYSLVIKSFLYTKSGDGGLRALDVFNQMKTNYMEFGDLRVRPDLTIYADLFSVLTKSNLVTVKFSDTHKGTSGSTELSMFDQLHSLLEEMDGLVNPLCWAGHGESTISRMAWHITESNILSVSEKVSLMFKLRRLADQHSVKLDHTITQVLKHFRQIESSTKSTSITTASSTTAVS